MLYKCEHCNYSTKRLCDLRRHENRKFPCNRKTKVDTCNLEDNNNCSNTNETMSQNNENMSQNDANMSLNNENMSLNNENISLNTDTIFTCSKCNKQLKCKQNLINHEKICDGYDKRQCKICLRMFATTHGKWKHTKYVKCSPPATPSGTQTINNTTNNDNSTNITNNIININNLNIRADFDRITNEDIQKIVGHLEKTDYVRMIRNNMNIGKYVIPRTMEQIYFNDEFPRMQTLKKERRNDKMVEVHVGKGKWEKRLIDDIFKMVVSKVEEYHSQYFKSFEQRHRDVVVGSTRWKQLMRPIKSFGNTMLWYEGFKGEDIEGLGIDLNYPDDDEEMEKERERRNREMEQLVGEKVYEETLSRERAAAQAQRAATATASTSGIKNK